MLLTESIEVHDTLNPKLYNGMEMKQEVFDKLTQIYKEFLDFIDIPLNIVDVEVVGSNASYNYNENSDIDLHIIVNSEVTYVEPTILRQLYNDRKGAFNRDYDITVEGIPVELYIEDVNDGNATNGRYSLLEQRWIIEPKPIHYEIPDITQDLMSYQEKCSELLLSDDAEQVRQFINDLYMMRKLGLAEGGEASTGNLIFKELRSINMLQDLKDHYYELRSKDLSI